MTRIRMIRTAPVLALAAAALVLPAALGAQEDRRGAPPARVDSLEARVARLEALVDSLQARLARAVELAAAPEAPEPRQPPEEAPEVAPADELAALREAAAAAAEEARAEPAGEPAPAREGRTRDLQILNPEISITGDIVGGLTAPSEAGANFEAVPREFEFSFQSALDPYTRTKIFVTREEEFEVAGLEAGEEGEEEGGFEIEEGYMYWVGLPGGFGARLGKFRQEIGLYNRWHNHALLEVERPLPAVAFLGEEGLIQTGASLTLPSFALGPATQTAWFEVTQSSNEALFGEGRDLSYLGRLQSFFDLGPTSFFQLGATGVYADNDGEEIDLESRLLGLDFYFRWTPRPLYRDLSVKAEWYLAERESPEEKLTGDGGYVQANARLSRRWTLGLRGDYVDGFGPEPEIFQLAPSITWWQSEWVRLRLQYNLVKPEGVGTDHTLLFQTVWAVGPHKHEAY